MSLVERMLSGDTRALARLISLIENRDPSLPQLMEKVYQHAGQAYVIGVTGPPGAGKSTLVDKITVAFREQNEKVGVVAIDPSSPFSGGALLGDRVRMSRHAADPGVYIRSLGSRGSHGGLSLATREVVRTMDAAGYKVIIVETVGVGQTELGIMELADTVVVVFVPESGDTIQTMKAGLTEIADVFVVNKSDRDGAANMARELMQMIDMVQFGDWEPQVVATAAVKDEGIDELFQVLGEHRKYLRDSKAGEIRKKNDYLAEFTEVLLGVIGERIRGGMADGELMRLIQEVKEGKANPYFAALQVLREPELLRSLFQQNGRND